jgi:hypothetical protein
MYIGIRNTTYLIPDPRLLIQTWTVGENLYTGTWYPMIQESGTFITPANSNNSYASLTLSALCYNGSNVPLYSASTCALLDTPLGESALCMYAGYNTSISSLGATFNVQRSSDNEVLEKMGDANGDGIININDVTILQLDWGDHCNYTAYQTAWQSWGPHIVDFNGDGSINIQDVTILEQYWGE